MNTSTATETLPIVHPFQVAGLGLAPFKYIGAVEQDRCYGEAVISGRDGVGPMVTTKPGGTCAYCGTYIVNMFNVQSSDGKVFHVGSDCIAKVYGPTHKIVRLVNKVVAARTKARKLAREAAAIAEGLALISRDDVRAELASKPHPTPYMAKQGQTLLGWVEFVINHSNGNSGKLRAAYLIRKASETLAA